MTDLPPWRQRIERERAEWLEKAAACCRRAAMALKNLTAEEIAERDRLLALPLGAEDKALFWFIWRHQIAGTA